MAVAQNSLGSSSFLQEFDLLIGEYFRRLGRLSPADRYHSFAGLFGVSLFTPEYGALIEFRERIKADSLLLSATQTFHHHLGEVLSPTYCVASCERYVNPIL